MRFLIIAALAVLSIATHAHAQAPRTYTASDLTEDRGYTTLGELELSSAPVEAERPAPPPARATRPTRMAPAPAETWILEPRLHPALCARYGYPTPDGCMIPSDRVARERPVTTPAAYAPPAQSTERMIRVDRRRCQLGYGTPVFVDPVNRGGYQGCIPPQGGLARWDSPRSGARVAPAPHRYGYAPQRSEMALHRYGDAPLRTASAPQRTESAPLRASSAPHRVAPAPHRRAPAPFRY